MKTFVLLKIEIFLRKNGWGKIWDHSPEIIISPYLDEYWVGSQRWQKYCSGLWELDISYDENVNHQYTLWCGSDAMNPETTFS